MGISLDVIGQSYNMLFKNRTVLILGIVGAAITAVATALFTAPLLAIQNDSAAALAMVYSPSFWAGMVLGVLVLLLISVFMAGAIISAASLGDKAGIGRCLKKASSRYISLIGTCIICGIVGFLVLIPGMTLVVAGALGFGGVVAMLIGIVLLIVPGMYVMLRLVLSDAACVVGGKRAVESVKKSWAIAKGNLWSIVIVLLVLGVIGGVVGGVVSYVSTVAGTFVSALFSYPTTIALVLIYTQLSKVKK